ncbi:SDR family NAD(P)-dependent oxidoreductase [Staphylococcus ureilyticus]|uniref:SDR family oxidoreductase n=1 Tax=Staphylococcus ureilyticus TaxID=94138 RepID=A0AB34AJ51_STAUR|nr:SDR family NAD(P)-dependent oxidoreductase [Staphylococcus ureilyticus]PNZ46252.1 short-chain dehydrogenase [Staphylococcus ureilyticus]QKU17965.1 SDR family NAD(P)-dependent oxidoreductase [Staphylococcus cohnii]GEQ02549.1 SDR family oxidoreductase [Staphylococcus ureilyticus]
MIGKHFILTGGTSGLGKAILKTLLTKKVHVTVLARNPEKLKQFITQYNTEHLNIIKCDLQSQQEIINLKKYFQHQTIDGLIYCSGLGYFKSIEDHTSVEMFETYKLNVLHFNLLMKVIQPAFSKNPIIVGIGSQAAFISQGYAAHYGASKAAFNQLLNALRIEKPNYHIMTVNTGPIATPFHEKADPTMKFAKKYSDIMLDPEKLANQIIEGIIRQKLEINQPRWMHNLLKIYQLMPRFIEKTLLHYLKTKGNATSKMRNCHFDNSIKIEDSNNGVTDN